MIAYSAGNNFGDMRITRTERLRERFNQTIGIYRKHIQEEPSYVFKTKPAAELLDQILKDCKEANMVFLSFPKESDNLPSDVNVIGTVGQIEI